MKYMFTLFVDTNLIHNCISIKAAAWSNYCILYFRSDKSKYVTSFKLESPDGLILPNLTFK